MTDNNRDKFSNITDNFLSLMMNSNASVKAKVPYGNVCLLYTSDAADEEL
jgi:hypothetical protein